MSLAYTHERLQLPETLQSAVARVPPPGLDDQDGRGRLRGGLRRRGRLPADVRCSTASGTRRAGSAPALFVAAVVGCADVPAGRCTAGSGGTAGSSNSPGCCAGSTRASATSCWASSSWCATTSSRPARARSARRPSAGRRGRAAARLPRRRARTRGIGSGPGWRPCRSSSALGAGRRSSRPRPRNAWARLLVALERHAPLHLRRGRAPARPSWSSRTASRSRSRRGSPSSTVWQPGQGEAQLGGQTAGRRPARATAATSSSCRRRSIPAGSTSRIGDAAQRVRIEPTLRPELTSVVADVDAARLPRAARSRSRRTSAAARSRWSRGARRRSPRPPAASSARRQVDGQPRTPAGATVASPTTHGRRLAQDGVPLAGQVRPGGQGAVHAGDHRPRRRGPDASPARTCRGRRSCSTPSCSASRSSAQDDFGVKRIGMEWQGIDNPVVKTPAKGERILAAGGHDKERSRSAGTFSAKSLGIEPQPVSVRVFVEDYFPGRPRVYSPTYTLLRAQRRAARHLAHRAVEQVAPPVARSPRPRDAALRDQQAAAGPGGRRARPARDPPHGSRTRPRPSGPTAAGSRAWSTAGEDLVRRRCATPSSASATSRNGPRCSRSSRTSPATGCRRSPTC